MIRTIIIISNISSSRRRRRNNTASDGGRSLMVSLHADVRKSFVTTFLDTSSDEFFVIFRFRVHVARFEKNLNLRRRRG